MEELALHILDLAQNSIEAGARKVRIEVIEDLSADRLTIRISDDGRGMSLEVLRRVLDPFYTTRTTRRVGLGLSLLAQATHLARGDLKVESQPGEGTTVDAVFQRSHIDRAPLGNLSGTLLVLMVGNQEVLINYRHAIDGQVFEIDGEEIRGILDGVRLDHPEVLRWLGDLLAEDPVLTA